MNIIPLSVWDASRRRATKGGATGDGFKRYGRWRRRIGEVGEIYERKIEALDAVIMVVVARCSGLSRIVANAICKVAYPNRRMAQG